MSNYDTAERLLIDMPIGSVLEIPAALLGWHSSFWQHQDTGIVAISPGAYCRALGLSPYAEWREGSA